MPYNNGNFVYQQDDNSDEKITYHNLLTRIELAIKHIKELGINTKKYEDYVSEIKNTPASKVQTLPFGSKKVSYAPNIAKLQALIEELDAYDTYVRIYNTALHIEGLIANKISKEELENQVTTMISCLVDIDNMGSLLMDINSDMVTRFYQIVYKVIQKEILVTGDSQVFAYIDEKNKKEPSLNATSLNAIIEEELKKYPDSQLIKNKLHEINKNGMYSDLLDLSLIKLIMAEDKSLYLPRRLTDITESKLTELEKTNETMYDQLNRIERLSNKQKEHAAYTKKAKRKLSNRGVIFSIVASLFITGLNIVTKWIIEDSTHDYYDASYKIYSTETDNTTTITGTAIRENDSSSLDIRVFSDAYSGTGDRSYIRIDASNEDSTDLKSILGLSIENFDSFTKETLPESEAKQISYEPHKEVVEGEYTYKETKKEGKFLVKLVFGYFLYLFGVLIIDAVFSGLFIPYADDPYLYSTIFTSKLREAFKLYKKEADICEEISDELQAAIEEMLTLVNKNAFLRERFDIIYKQNLPLLRNKEELKKRVDEIIRLNDMNIDEASKNEAIKAYKKRK